ncbi:hypothetical protein V6N13_089664 [Hibiscus sabdariffa]|uniref:Glycosyltransferase n=1 Tax=Hibiscus sabdariffa TaxID=183260 RepID=A0ABR2QJ96_9ROSI
MESNSFPNKPHAVCVAFPAQGHVNPLLKVAKLLHHKGFHITFVNTDYTHQRLLQSRGPYALHGLPDFRFQTIPDGRPERDVATVCDSTTKNCLAPFRQLLARLNSAAGVPPVTCIVSDGLMAFTLEAAQELGIPGVLFWSTGACGFSACFHFQRLKEEGVTPFKDELCLTNGYLDTVIEWIPGMKNIRIRDLPSFVRTTDPDDIMLNFLITQCERGLKASAVILNTFNHLEHDVLESLSSMLPRVHAIGPLHLLLNNISHSPSLNSIGSNLWEEEPQCLQWLDSKDPDSVVYVNFGSTTEMTANQLVEFAWGLANTKHPFLWIIRPGMVKGESAILPPDFVEETKERSLMASWCPQEKVLNHPAVAGFLTHGGWNSIVESISSGVPMICWPFFGDHPTNCRFTCNEWGIGMEIDNDVKRDEVEKLVRELVEGEKGMEMKKNCMELRKKAEEAACLNGPSSLDLESLINEVLLK